MILKDEMIFLNGHELIDEISGDTKAKHTMKLSKNIRYEKPLEGEKQKGKPSYYSKRVQKTVN